MSPLRQFTALVALLAVTLTAGGIGSLAWYEGGFQAPPGLLFGPVWAVPYVLTAVAAWLAWRKGNAEALVRFATQLVLYVAWSWLFFGLHAAAAAFIGIAALLAAIAVTTVAFWQHSLAAGILMLPYLGWVAFVGALNFTIWWMGAPL
jgi:tryptophan-rich sensory protein